MSGQRHDAAGGNDEAHRLGHMSRRKAPLLHTMRAVAWSFLGVRQSTAHEEDTQRLNPVHVIVTGLVLGVIFVVTILLLVRWVVASGIAA